MGQLWSTVNMLFVHEWQPKKLGKGHPSAPTSFLNQKLRERLLVLSQDSARFDHPTLSLHSSSKPATIHYRLGRSGGQRPSLRLDTALRFASPVAVAPWRSPWKRPLVLQSRGGDLDVGAGLLNGRRQFLHGSRGILSGRPEAPPRMPEE